MTDPQPPPGPPAPSEPATAFALWPTFMRRTLPADAVPQEHPQPQPAA